MKKKNRPRWYKVIRKTILITITVIAFAFLIASIGAMIDTPKEAIIGLVASLTWIVPFGYVNGWMRECPK